MTDLVVRPAVAGEIEDVAAVFGGAMMFDASPDDLARRLFEPERTLVATDGPDIVGTTRALTRDLSVPGAVVPAAHVTGVGVRPTYRRRGVMSSLITRQLREVPEPIAVLWASEPAIYGRFGYGAAAWSASYEVDLHRVGPRDFRTRPGEITELSAETAVKELAPMLRALQERRPGVSGRSELEWQERLQDKKDDRNGQTERRILVHRDEAGAVDGYALWRGKLEWGPAGPGNQVNLQELVAIDPRAYEALWNHLLTMDLAAKLSFGYGALDEPVQQLVSTPTALNRRVSESLWLRVTDVVGALEQRRYAVPLDLVLAVTDDVITENAGRYRLTTADGLSVSCVRTEDPADVSLSVTELGAAYLGGRPLIEFAATGRVTEQTPGALNAATAAFGWPVHPASIEVF